MLFAGALLFGAWTRACAGGACPSIANLTNYDPDQASRVFAADGRLITDFGLQRRTVVPLAEISPALVAAFLAVEDKRFYRHGGVDWIRVAGSLVRAPLAVIRRQRVQGWSTITMQLARNVFPDRIDPRERRGFAGLKRKLREVWVARALETTYSKDRILI